MNRGNGKQRIFDGDDDYRRFIDQLQDALDKDDVILYAYCLMPNHFHLFVETPHANMDQFMARLGTAYGMYFRYKHYRPGHCFQGRYRAPLVHGDDYVIRLMRYIHLNPVKTPATNGLPPAKKWHCLMTHHWSSLDGYLSAKASQDFIDYRWLAMFGSKRTRRTRYGAYVKQMLDEDDPVLGESMKASPYAIGDAAFRSEVDAWIKEQTQTADVPADFLKPPGKPISLDILAEAVAKEFNFDASALRTPRARLGFGRGAFVELACRLGHRSQRDVARYLKCVSEHGVGKARNGLLKQMREDAALDRRIESLALTLKAKV